MVLDLLGAPDLCPERMSRGVEMAHEARDQEIDRLLCPMTFAAAERVPILQISPRNLYISPRNMTLHI